MPDRIQLSRRKGWRKPEGAVVVSRPSKWGNPFTVAGCLEAGFAENEEQARAVVVGAFRDWLRGNTWAAGSDQVWEQRRLDYLLSLPELAGKDLCCWCRPGTPCHADVLIELANG